MEITIDYLNTWQAILILTKRFIIIYGIIMLDAIYKQLNLHNLYVIYIFIFIYT